MQEWGWGWGKGDPLEEEASFYSKVWFFPILKGCLWYSCSSAPLLALPIESWALCYGVYLQREFPQLIMYNLKQACEMLRNPREILGSRRASGQPEWFIFFPKQITLLQRLGDKLKEGTWLGNLWVWAAVLSRLLLPLFISFWTYSTRNVSQQPTELWLRAPRQCDESGEMPATLLVMCMFLFCRDKWHTQSRDPFEVTYANNENLRYRTLTKFKTEK